MQQCMPGHEHPTLKTSLDACCWWTGTLPASWRNGSFPSLTQLQLINTSLSGSLPPEWGTPMGFNSLSVLTIAISSITGNAALTWQTVDLVTKQFVWIAFRSMEFRSRLSKAVLPSHLQLWCLRYLVHEHTACCTTSSALYMPFSVTHEY